MPKISNLDTPLTSTVTPMSENEWVGKLSNITKRHKNIERVIDRIQNIDADILYKRAKAKIDEKYSELQRDLARRKSDELRKTKERIYTGVENGTLGGDEENGYNTGDGGDDSNEKVDIKIKYHAVPPSQFYIGGVSACTSISVCCCFFFTVKHYIPLQSDFGKVVKKGVELWRKRDMKDKHQMLMDVWQLPEMDEVRDELEIKNEMGGMMRGVLNDAENVSYTVKSVVDYLSKSPKKMAAVFTVRDYSTTLLYDPKKESKYWIFDSHGGYEKHASTLIELGNTESMIYYIHKKYPPTTFDDNQFSVVFFCSSK